MEYQLAFFHYEASTFQIPYLLVDNQPWFKGKDIATTLGYADTQQAIRVNVDADFKCKMEELRPVSDTPLDYNTRNSIFINEAGLWSLVLRSEKPEAKQFQKWIVKDLLPSIRANGTYSIPRPINNKIILNNERDLHYKVVNFIKKKYPEVMIAPGLGEYQQTSELRVDAYRKGYLSGQPDILILNLHKNFNGFALELKHPGGTGRLSANQHTFLSNLQQQNWKVLVSDSYDDILMELIEYFHNIRLQCQYCCRRLKNKQTLGNHYKYFHRITSNTDEEEED